MNKFNISMLSISVAMGCFGIAAPALAETVTPNNQAVSEHEQFSQLRHRWASYFVGDSAMRMNEKQKIEINKVNRQAKQWLDTLAMTPTGLWPELALDDDSTEGRQQLGVTLNATYDRLFQIARAYKMVGGELSGDKATLNVLVEALSFLNAHYYRVGTPEYGNWWQWELGISRSVNNTLVLLYDEIPKELIEHYVDATRYFVPRPTHLSEGYGAPYSTAPMIWESTGGNRTDNAQVVLIRGLLDNNEEEIKTAIAALSSVIPYVESGDGFYRDGSFIQHKDLPYSGTYGLVMIQGLGLLMDLVANTQFHANDPQLQKIYPLILKTYAPLLVDGRMMDFVNGRAISRVGEQSNIVGQSLLSAMMLYLHGAPEPYRSELRAVITSNLAKTGGLQTSRIFSNHQVAERLMATREVKIKPKASHIQFPDMDRVVHHRDDWTFGVAMHSDRVGNYESINGENLKGWHTADGMTYLYTQHDRFHQGYWPLVDAYRLPGTTTLQMSRELSDGQLSAQREGRNGAMDWTGGAVLNQYGVAGMKFVNHNRELSALKSWFMFEDQIVAVGSNIENRSDVQAITTIDNRLLSDTGRIVVDGKVVTQAQQGRIDHFTILENSKPESAIHYHLLSDSPIELSRHCREGDWSDIGVSKGAVAGCFAQASIMHDAQNNHYAYRITPYSASSSTQTNSIELVASNNGVHAVKHAGLNLFAANFFDQGQAGAVQSDSALSIVMQEQDDELHIAVSDPTRSWFDRDFVIDGQFELVNDDQGRVELSEGNRFSVDLNNMRGSSYRFTVKRVKA